jgi:hypothetical protein
MKINDITQQNYNFLVQIIDNFLILHNHLQEMANLKATNLNNFDIKLIHIIAKEQLRRKICDFE